MRKTLSLFLCLLLVFALSVPVFGAHMPEVTQIHTVEELLSIGDNPSGSYILMSDLDMTGVEWPSPDFSGSFDGNGHAILNLTLSQPGPSMPESYDGNLKTYETSYIGLFGTMQNAEVKNLNLVNIRAVAEMDSPVFLAGIAGYFQDSTISNCTVTGILELRAHDRMFGIGGIAGFGGTGLIEQCTVDMTLICTDTDDQTKDEQFLGGIYATGFVDVKDCIVTIDGYVSEHGYVHSGGIVGMYMQQPFGIKIMGKLSGNKVYGKITFFENNRDRRAYCRPIAGETLAFCYSEAGNKYEFERDERKEYDVELRPHMCSDPVYTETVTPATCNTFGHSAFTCDSCGYSFNDCYTLYQHTVSEWTEVKSATAEEAGLAQGSCDLCGAVQEKTIPIPEPEPTETTETTEAPEPSAAPQIQPSAPAEPAKHNVPLIFTAICAGVVAIALIILLKPKKKKGKFQK